ncbi:uncharacterized protein LOC134842288 [Symsagittifera roscoffensis]|uniref:uncharacterized protein LOC134842288 n=1 Tax=Symsagittifera roscoffensis TaxID=84072 RepID=UPI00307BE792
MNIQKNLFKTGFGNEDTKSGSSTAFNMGSKFYASVPPSARSAAVKATSSALSSAAQNEKVQAAAADRLQSSMNQQLQTRAGMNAQTSNYLAGQMSKGVPGAMSAAGKNETMMNDLSSRMVDGSSSAVFGGASMASDSGSSRGTSNEKSENKPSSGATSVEELKRRLGTLYGSSYTPTYTPTSTRSQQPTNQNIASTSNSTSASSFITSYNSNSASSYGGSANSSGYINQGFSSNYTSSGSSWDTQFESKPKTQFADPFAAFNRAEEPSSTYTENSNSGAQVAKNHSGFPTSSISTSGSTDVGATGTLYEAIHDFESGASEELNFKKGDLIVLSGTVTEEWWLGRLKHEPPTQSPPRMFPANFVKLKPAGAKPPPPIPKKPFSNTQQKYLNASSLKDSGEPYCVALYDYNGQCPGDLSFRAGDEIKLLKTIDANWKEGELFGSKGIFPSNFVQVKRDISLSPSSASSSRQFEAVAPGKTIGSLTSNNGIGIDKRWVLYDYQATKHDELSVKTGDEVVVVSKMPGSEDWLFCQLGTKTGYLPTNFMSS